MTAEIKTDNIETINNSISKLDEMTIVQKILNKLIVNEGFLCHNLEENEMAESSNGYVAKIYQVDIEGTTIRGPEKLNILIKVVNDDSLLSFMSFRDISIREYYFYSELSKMFTELQKQYKLPIEERFKTVKFYDESVPDVIILDNMKIPGFKTYSNSEFISLDYAESAVRLLAKFHCISFVLREKNPEYFNKYLKSLDYAFNFGDIWETVMNDLVKVAKSNVDADMVKKLDNYLPNLTERYVSHVADKSTKLVLCHGDYRCSNLLFKENNGKITQMIPIDFQIIHYGCPAMDFLYFIYGSTDRSFRKKHLNDLKNIYYDTLSSFLKYFDIDLENIMTKADFENMFNARLEYGVLSGFLLTCLITKTNNDSNLDEKYKKKIQDLLEDFVEFGFL